MPDPASIGEAQFVRSSSSESRTEPMLQILRAYCLGMLKGCSYVNERIQMEHYYEVWPIFPHVQTHDANSSATSRRKRIS